MPVPLRRAGESADVMAKITIDGNTREVADGTLVLEAALEQGINIPTFCYMARLAPLASCRMCLGEI